MTTDNTTDNTTFDKKVYAGMPFRYKITKARYWDKTVAKSVTANTVDDVALEPYDGLAAFDQVIVFYTHGHMYGVKYDLDTLADAASARGAEVALFGHTHIPHAETRSGVFLFNPGSCGRCYTGPNTYGILTLADGKVVSHEHKEVPKA